MYKKNILLLATTVILLLGLGAINSCSPSASSGAAAGTVNLTMKGAAL